jgi:hypothetical protein
LWLLATALGIENVKRYGKIHKSSRIVSDSIYYEDLFPDIGLTSFAQTMPDEYKNEDPVVAYRTFYLKEKISFAKWKNGAPKWVVQ